MENPCFAYFDQGQIPTITCVNKSSIDLSPLYKNFPNLIATLQAYITNYLTPIWGMTAKLVIADDVTPGTWGFLFIDNADVADALGYHDLTKDNLPLSRVFVETTLNDKEQPSVTASHELGEMLLDPGIQLGAQGPNNSWYAYEIADAVENDTFLIDSIPVSNFVYPAWFEGFRAPNSTQFDYLRLCTRPFEIRPGGYMPVYKNGDWMQIFSSRKDKLAFNSEKHNRLLKRQKQILASSTAPKVN